MFQAQLQLLKEAYGLVPGGVDYPLLAVFAFFNPALGITTVLPELDPKQPMKASAKRLLEGMSKASITQAFGSPILWQKLAEAALAKGQSFPQVERLFLAGCATPPGVAEALKKVFPNAHIYIPYGATEALPLTQLDAESLIHAQTQPTHAGTYLGKALPGVAFTILPLDSDNNTPLPYETVGEVAVCGPIVSPSYDHLIEATHKAKFTDPQGRLWHRMGDVGVLDATGSLWFLGRVVECIQNGPLTWYTDPCETVFLNHPLVKRAALIGLGPKHQQTPAIIIQLKDKTYLKNKVAKESLESALLTLARSHPTTEAIKTIFFRSTFPVDVRHNAKIHRLALAKEYTHKR